MVVCNTVPVKETPQVEIAQADAAYERCIEAGSAHFAQAFSEALGLISDLENNDPAGARLRLKSMAALTGSALQHYKSAGEIGGETGLTEQHARRLRQAGLDARGVGRVMGEAERRGFWRRDGAIAETLAAALENKGYPGMMSLYLEKVQEIHDYALAAGSGEAPVDAVAWQELGWKLTALFGRALEMGKAIAILNTLTFRLPRPH